MRTYKDIKSLKIDTDSPGIRGWVIHLEMRDKSSETGTRHALFSVDYGDDFLEAVFKAIKLQLETGDRWRNNKEKL